MNLFDRCSEKTLCPELTWMNEPEHWCFKTNHSLAIIAPSKADFFIDPSGNSVRLSAPFLYTLVSGNFTMVTRVSVEMNNPYDSGCLMIMTDARRWAKLCIEYYNNKPSIVSVVTNNYSDDCVSCKVESRNPYLRVTRAANCFTFSYSEDGHSWDMIRYFGLECPQEIKLGLVAQSPIGESCRMTFDEFNVTDC